MNVVRPERFVGDTPMPSARLRARRLRLDKAGGGTRVVASAVHPRLGSIHGAAFDLSFAGAGLRLVGVAAGAIEAGDRLTTLELTCHDTTLYRGDALVRHVSPHGSAWIVGIEAGSNGIDLAVLHRLDRQHAFAARLSSALEERDEGVSYAFKAWVGDLRWSLERIKTFLDAEERALFGVDAHAREEMLRDYAAEATPAVVRRLHRAGAELAAFVQSLDPVAHAAYRRCYQAQIRPFLAHAPLLRRALEKPLGYPGDYEVMNMLYRDHLEGTSLFGKVVNVYAGQEAAAQATINRLEYLCAELRREAAARERVRMVSLGCGPAREIALLLGRHPELGRRIEILLIDHDERALAHCERTLSAAAALSGLRLHLVPQSVPSLLRHRSARESLGACDFIYSAGLFDYFDRRTFRALLAALYSALTDGGRLLIGNVSCQNPTRYFMEYGLEWFLVHRTPQELLDLANDLSPAPARVQVDAEPSGVNLFLHVAR
jgi:extracellular factor (EF) 3-hydroxypalmitic acid methyl ester biosynthesis protein